MKRVRAPEFVLELVRDPSQRGVLISGAVALFAVGLVPRLLSPSLPDAQERLRDQDGLANAYLLVAFLAAAAVIAGGLVADFIRRRAVFLLGLAVMAGSGLICLLIDGGPIYYVAAVCTVVASGVVLAYGVGSVAAAYEGITRATALGVVYGVYGAGTALAPLLLTIVLVRLPSSDPTVPAGFAFESWPAYLFTALAAVVGLLAAWRWMPPLPGGLPAPKPLVAAIAVWAIGALAIAVGVLALNSPGSLVLPLILIIPGLIGVGLLSYWLRPARKPMQGLYFDQRGLGAALVVGVALGLAQAVPMMILPPLFQQVMGYGPVLAMVALAPFVVALLVAGPVSGLLLQRLGPRGMLTAGTFVLGLGSVLLAVILNVVGREASYLFFVVPLAMIGAGFVIGSAVRTAIVFAGTPRGLAGMAAGINEASVALGARIGIVAATTLIATQATASAQAIVAGRADAEVLLAEFRSALSALGTPRFQEVIQLALQNASEAKTNAYLTAYVDGVQVALFVAGLIGIAGAAVAWFLTGRRDPLRTVFDHQDERRAVAAVAPAETNL